MHDTAEAAVLRREMAALGRKEPKDCPTPRPCDVCGLQLDPRDRMVHKGRCARARETALQRKRRQRGRIARG